MKPCRVGWTIIALALILPAAGCKEQDVEIPKSPPPPETEPVNVPVTLPAEERLQPPHGGALLPIADDEGFVEWTVDDGRLYFLDAKGQPLGGADRITFHVQTTYGPSPIPLTPCPPDGADANMTDTCYTTEGGTLKHVDTRGVLRFELSGRMHRVLLQWSPSESQPSAGIDVP